MYYWCTHILYFLFQINVVEIHKYMYLKVFSSKPYLDVEPAFTNCSSCVNMCEHLCVGFLRLPSQLHFFLFQQALFSQSDGSTRHSESNERRFKVLI